MLLHSYVWGKPHNPYPTHLKQARNIGAFDHLPAYKSLMLNVSFSIGVSIRGQL